MAEFTPQEIEQFLQQFFDVVGARQYVGARYVPIFGRAGSDTVEWDDTAPYEPLTVVLHQGVSYVSRRYVPAGIDIANTDYWVETYRFNAQVEQYRQEVLGFQDQIDGIREVMESDYVPFPDSATYPKYGTLGQVLTTLTGGETKWEDPVIVDAAVAEPLIETWLDEHPEATTTVQNGSITLQKLNESLSRTLLRGIATDTTITDMNDVPFNTVLSSNTNTMLANLPPFSAHTSAFGFAVITFSPVHQSVDAYNIEVQLCVPSTGPDANVIFCRTKAGGPSGQWTDWNRLANDGDVTAIYEKIESVETSNKVVRGIATDTTITDMNDVPFNTVLSSNTNTMLANLPPFSAHTSAFGFAVITFSPVHQSVDAYNIEVQLCVPSTGPDANVIFCRTKAGGPSGQWTDWKRMADTNEMLAVMQPTMNFDLSMFPKMVACGDSYCGGSLHNAQGTSLGLYDDASWAVQAARQCGGTCKLYAAGGRGCYDFIHDNSNNLTELVSDMADNFYDAVMLEFGINDSNPGSSFGGVSGGQSYIGSSADIDAGDPSLNANSFWGNMSRIISAIKAASPNTRIILVGLMRKDSGAVRYGTFNDALAAIAQYHDVLFVNMYDDPYMFSATYNANIYGKHPTYLGYNGIAKALNRQFSVAAASSSYISQYYGNL